MTDEAVAEVLRTCRTWAVVGCSPDPARDSHRVARFLQRSGYRVLPVNPHHDGELLGEACHPAVGAIPTDVEVDVVDVFRRSSEAGVHVDEAIERGARAVWLQLGVVDGAAAERARSAGLLVVMDRCPIVELPRMR